MGDAQRLSPDEQLAFAREQFESGRDFTVAVEEEFALLDPETLGLVNRFTDLQATAPGTPLEPPLAGELIASEAEVKPARCGPSEEPAGLMAGGRAKLRPPAEPLGIALAAAGTHPWSPWRDQKIID